MNRFLCDREFMGCVEEDLEGLVSADSKTCVVFPKLKPTFQRVLRHQATVLDLAVFYIGVGPNQAAVICNKYFLRDDLDESLPLKKSIVNMSDVSNPKAVEKGCFRRSKPTQLYYVPPAQRGSSRKGNSQQKEPATKIVQNVDDSQPSTSGVTDCQSRFQEEIEPIQSSSKTCSVDLLTDRLERSELIGEEIAWNTQIEEDVLRDSTENEEKVEPSTDRSIPANIDRDKSPMMKGGGKVQVLEEHTEQSTKSLESEVQTGVEKMENSPLIISSCKKSDKEVDNDSEEIQRAIVNINRKSRSLIKYVKNDDTLRISENVPRQLASDKSEKEPDISSWEELFDENGDLQQKYLDQITKRVGHDVKVVKASQDYSEYQNADVQDLEHVIELFDFPSTFRTQDLMQLYSNVHQDPMYVKWCDDTHALLVLSSPAQAQRALNIEHAVIKSRPLSQASAAAALAACSSDLKPAMKRPPTNMQTARRLISTHLGTRSAINKEVAEQERRALKDAREQRRQERQNEKDAWEGRPRNAKA